MSIKYSSKIYTDDEGVYKFWYVSVLREALNQLHPPLIEEDPHRRTLTNEELVQLGMSRLLGWDHCANYVSGKRIQLVFRKPLSTSKDERV